MNHLITLATTRKNSLKILLWIIFISLTRNGITQDKISRKQLLVAHLAQQPVKKVDVQEINFEPGQKAGAHKHLCPVAGYIVSGTVLFETNGDSLKILKAGDAFSNLQA
ncbi:hypothetical protein LWM68_11520 [Niabella sp. W65]|nr:hypothetical protein [Niabella sp. W65]MCH7363326.1 hypothetical protein [Niabella sp. W65]ULT39250.1 hypothetical protein KRR40_30265 [Niabella sp. I65]